MTDYDNTNRGALFKNDDKQSDSHPDYKGSIDVDGDEFWLSAWIKTSKAGKKYMSLSIKPKEERTERERGGGHGRSAPQPASSEFQDDEIGGIPFATNRSMY